MIDVIIPVYNAADSLDESMRSLAEQTFRDFRVIAVDDGSTDGSSELLARWAACDPRFTVLSKKNGGIVEALNTGVGAVTAKYTARLDADDIALPNRLERQVAYLEANPDCVAVGCAVEHIDRAGNVLDGFPQPGPPEEADAAGIPAREPYIIHPFLMARSDALRSVGGYRYVPHSEDSDLFWRLAERGRLHNLPEKLGQYRMHLDSISGSSIINGRIMAVGSQLGALSARRRRAGKPDVEFGPHLMRALRDAGELEAMCAYVASMMLPAEAPHFRLSVAVKLLELANYRPYEIEQSDCAFVNIAQRHTADIVDRNAQKEIDWFVSRTAGRLMRKGKLGHAAALLPTRLWLRASAKALLDR